MKIDVPSSDTNHTFNLKSNLKSLATPGVSDISEINSSHEYIPFYALHNRNIRTKNLSLLKEEIRILEARLKELKEKLQQLQS